MFLALFGWVQSGDRLEFFGGYSSAGHDFTGGHPYSGSVRLNRGWNASANLKLNRFSQFVADFGGYYLSLTQSTGFCNFNSSTCNTSVHTLMFGPQMSVPIRQKFIPFGHFLMGTALASQHNTFSAFQSSHSFSFAAGGGVDYELARHFAVRGQADFIRTHFTSLDDQVPFQNSNNRISAGIVIHF